jgi:CorA-like Mg2+ transporter protein
LFTLLEAVFVMALDSAAVKELLQKLDNDREAYLSTLTKAHDTLARALTVSNIPRPNSPPAVPYSPTESTPRSQSRNTGLTPLFDVERTQKGSIFTGEESSDSDDDESLFVQQTLPSESFSENDFRNHLKQHKWDKYAGRILETVLTDKDLLRSPKFFQDDGVPQNENASQNTHAIVYEVGADGAALVHRAESQEPSQAIWQSINSTNADQTRRRLATGKITIVREPSPLLFGAVHLTMDRHFDMDEIFRLLSDESPTRAYMKGCFDSEPTQQRSFLFCFKYYTIIGRDREPMPWQSSDKDLRNSKTHIPITSCSSIVALSLSGKPSTMLKNRSRRAKATVGHVFDPFAPWRVLSIQCYPDWKSTVDTHDSNRHYVNGPEAFLVTLLAEYRDAQKRFFEIARRVTDMTTPPHDFMFNRETRDNLLFEDDQFTYSRRYFWATQTLAVMNDNIQAMINAYRDTFTEDVWTGEHKYIWPGQKDQSSRYANWRKRMGNLRKLFETEIKKLGNILDMNAQEIKDLKSLRDQLFSGTSVRESREALKQAEITVQQNRNIKLLTLVTIFFLPLTFVTSVFGMTNMPPEDSFIPFGVVTAVICIPTYLLIGILNSHTGQSSLLALFSRITNIKAEDTIIARPRRVRSEIGRTPPPLTPAQPRRQSRSLATYEGLASRSTHAEFHPALLESKDLKLTFSEPLQQPERVNTVKFNLDTFETLPSSPQRSATAVDISETAPHQIKQTSTDPGPRNDASRRSRRLFRNLSDRFWDEKKESPV